MLTKGGASSADCARTSRVFTVKRNSVFKVRLRRSRTRKTHRQRTWHNVEASPKGSVQYSETRMPQDQFAQVGEVFVAC